MANLNLPAVGQDAGTWGSKINAALVALNAELEATGVTAAAGLAGAVTSGAQTWQGIKTFAAKPVFPVRTLPVVGVDASGTPDATTYLRGDGTWSIPPGDGGGGGGGSANSPGTLNNPITNASAARPTGLTRVVWDTATDPTNWAIGDYNLQPGT